MLATDQVIIAMRNDRNLSSIVNNYLEQVESKVDISYYDFLNFSGLTIEKVFGDNINFQSKQLNHEELTAELQDVYFENSFPIDESFFD